MSPLRSRPVFWLASASTELDIIVRGIAADNPRAAEDLYEDIVHKSELLSGMPYMAAECPEYPRGRFIVHKGYVIYHTVHRTEIVIRAVKHGAMRFRKAWLRRKE